MWFLTSTPELQGPKVKIFRPPKYVSKNPIMPPASGTGQSPQYHSHIPHHGNGIASLLCFGHVCHLHAPLPAARDHVTGLYNHGAFRDSPVQPAGPTRRSSASRQSCTHSFFLLHAATHASIRAKGCLAAWVQILALNSMHSRAFHAYVFGAAGTEKA